MSSVAGTGATSETRYSSACESYTQRETSELAASEYMKLDFRVVLFTDECGATLDGPNGSSKGSQMEATASFVSDDNKVDLA